MKKLGFLANLAYALRKKIGWCPERPTPKVENLERFDLSKEMQYFEKPSISPYVLWGFIVPFVGLIFLILSLSWKIALLFLAGIFVILLGLVFFLPFCFSKEILLTKDKFHVKLGFSEDNVAIDDIISIELVDKPATLWGEVISPGGYSILGLLIFPIGTVRTRDAKWYIFGEKRTYFRIERRNGEAVCVGVTNPEWFVREFEKRVPGIASRLFEEVEKKAKAKMARYQMIPAEELYRKLQNLYMQVWGAGELERKINAYVKQGLSRENAIRKVAENEGI